MTQEQAETQRDALNAILSNAGVVDQVYKVREKFVPNDQSNWDVCLIPTAHNAKYDAATYPQLAGFGRVYAETISTVGAGTNYVAQFDINAEADPVLGPYLP